VNVGPLTTVVTGTQVGSLSVNGSVYVTQSMIFGVPTVVTASAGWSSVTPVSRMPTVTPRPSHVGWAEVKAAAPVSPIGM
jgi:hypothetical protein